MRSDPVRPPTDRGTSPQARLDGIAAMVDRCQPPPGQHLLVHAVDLGHDVDLGVKLLDEGQHPFDALAGVTGPEEWWAFGVRATGRAHHLHHPSRQPSSSVMTFLAARSGEEASVVRIGGKPIAAPGRAEGTVSDLCRRVLGRPTDPAPCGTAPLWTAMWLDRVMTTWNQPAQRGALIRSWKAIAALHPAFDDTEGTDRTVDHAGRELADRWEWADLRAGARPVPLPEGPLPTPIAQWMDDGFYARWSIGAFPSIIDLATDLHSLLGEVHGTRLTQSVLTLLR